MAVTCYPNCGLAVGALGGVEYVHCIPELHEVAGVRPARAGHERATEAIWCEFLLKP